MSKCVPLTHQLLYFIIFIENRFVSLAMPKLALLSYSLPQQDDINIPANNIGAGMAAITESSSRFKIRKQMEILQPFGISI